MVLNGYRNFPRLSFEKPGLTILGLSFRNLGLWTYCAFGLLRVGQLVGFETQHLSIYISLYEPRCEKTGLRGFQPGPTQTSLYSHRR